MMLGEVLRNWRTIEGLGVRAAAKVLGISPATLSRIENNENMDGATLAKILKWLLD